MIVPVGARATWLAVVVVAAAGCAHEVGWPGDRDERLVVAMPANIAPLDPRTLRDGHTGKVSRLVYRGLFRVRSDDLRAVPDVATSLTAPSPLLRCVTLRDDVRFHDGRLLRAADVAWSFRSAMDPGLRSPAGGLFRDRFDAIELPDGPEGLRVCFRLRAPVATLRTDLAWGLVPEGAPVDGGDPVGAGPYKVLRRDGDRGLVLERAAPPPPGRGAVPRYLVIRSLPDENTRLLALMAGDVDVVHNALSPSVLDVVARREGLAAARHPSLAVTYLTLNTALPGLDDRRVREALARALDRPWIVRERFGGAARVASSMLPAGHWAFPSDLEALPHDPAGAARLLDEAGLEPDADGVRLRLELLTSNDRLRRLVGRDLARQLARVGVALRVRSLELGTFLEHVRGLNYELAVLQLPEPIEPDMMRWMFSSLATPLEAPPRVTAGAPRPPDGDLGRWRRTPRRFVEPGLLSLLTGGDAACARWAAGRWVRGLADTLAHRFAGKRRGGGGNRSFWADPALDCRLDRARREEDPDRRAALYAWIQRRLARDLPVIFLWHEDNVVVHAEDLAPVEPGLRPDLAFLAAVRR